jgi:hypothetical protein
MSARFQDSALDTVTGASTSWLAVTWGQAEGSCMPRLRQTLLPATALPSPEKNPYLGQESGSGFDGHQPVEQVVPAHPANVAVGMWQAIP